jgi:NitT/TauT family transport system substrate-binding protein
LFAFVLALLLVSPIIAACGDDDDEDPTATAAEAAPTATTGAAAPTTTGAAEPTGTGASGEMEQITIGYVPVLIYAPLILADAKGYLAEQGIDATLEPLQGGSDLVTLTASGEFDIGVGGAGPAFFNAIAGGIELVIIAPLHFERDPNATPLVVSKARYDSGEITSAEDLEGLNVSVNARGATEYWLDQALRTGDLTIEDIELQTLGFGDVPAALESGALDGAMLGEPLVTAAEQEGILVRLVDGFISDFQPTFVFVNPSFAADNPDLLRRFMVAYLQGCRDIAGDDWATDENVAILEEATGVDAELIKQAARTYCEPDGEVDLEDLDTLQAFFGDRGLLEYDEPLDVTAIVDTTYAEEAVVVLGPYEE